MSQVNHIMPSPAIALPSKKESRLNFRFLDPELMQFIRNHKKYIWIAAIGSVIQFLLFKLMYPFPDFISDSYNYIWAASTNAPVSLWPVGYAKFLMLIHSIWYYDTFLIAIQYLIFQASLLYFFYCFCFFYNPAKNTMNVLFYCLAFNPITLYLSNCVLSDALFSSLTILWLLDQLWMIRRPKEYHILTQALLIAALFTIRYTAIYFPFVTAVSFIITNLRLKQKLLGIVSPWFLIIPFIIFTQQKTKEITGTAQFSVFGGWQIANNALYMYRYIKIDSSDLPKETRELDRWVKAFHKTAPPGYINLDNFPGTYFIKHSDAPLKQYMYYHFGDLEKKDSLAGYQSWGKVAPLYEQYGTFLIKKNIWAYFVHFILLNSKNYAYPYLEKFGVYNIGENYFGTTVVDWFHYTGNKAIVFNKHFQEFIFLPFPIVWAILNIFFLISCVIYLAQNWHNKNNEFIKKSYALALIFYLLNFIFSVAATPVVLRYQVIAFLIIYCYSLINLEKINIKRQNG